VLTNLTDHLGSIRTTIDQTGTVIGYDDYDPFGNVLPGRSYNAGTPNDLNKFTGHERDQEGGLDLDYMLARNYDSELGRFYSVNPMAAKHPNYTPFAYVYNNPLRLVDPLGMDSTQRAQAIGKAKEYLAKNDNGNGNSYGYGEKGEPGEKIDCSGLVSKCIKAAGETDPSHGNKNGVSNISKNTESIDEKEVIVGNIVILDGKSHAGLISLVERDKNGKIINAQMIDSGGKPEKGKSGPRVSNLIVNGKASYWGQRVDGYRKWDTIPDKPLPKLISTPTVSQDNTRVVNKINL
jgi:RHS repeat-associated protein